MTGMPFSDRGILDGLRAYLPSIDGTATPAARAFMDLDSALATHAAALERLDRAEIRVIAARGRVSADQPTEATDMHDSPTMLPTALRKGSNTMSTRRRPFAFPATASGRDGGPSPSGRRGSTACPGECGKPLTVFITPRRDRRRHGLEARGDDRGR